MKRKTLFWILVLGVLIYLFTPAMTKLIRLNRQTVKLEDEIQRLAAENQVLENELRLLKEDPVYVEGVARRLFKKSKEGEVIYKIVPQEELPRGSTESTSPTRG